MMLQKDETWQRALKDGMKLQKQRWVSTRNPHHNLILERLTDCL